MHKINTTPYLITGLLTDITKAPAMQVPYVALFPLSRAYRKKRGKKSKLSKVKKHDSNSISAGNVLLLKQEKFRGNLLLNTI